MLDADIFVEIVSLLFSQRLSISVFTEDVDMHRQLQRDFGIYYLQ
jgi:hypothetical protein